MPEGLTKRSLSGLTLTKIGKKANFSSLLRRNFATAKFGLNMRILNQNIWKAGMIRQFAWAVIFLVLIAIWPAIKCVIAYAIMKLYEVFVQLSNPWFVFYGTW